MSSVADLMKRLEELVRLPFYALMGIASDKLVYLTTEQGVVRLWVSNKDGSDKRPASGERVTALSRPEPDSNIIVYARDVTKGQELGQIYTLDVDSLAEEKALEMTPTRVIGLVRRGDKIVYSGAAEDGVGIFMGEIGGKAEKLYTHQGLLFVTDYTGKYIVGTGMFRGPRSYELFRYDVETGEMKVFTPKEGSVNFSGRARDGRLFFKSDYEGSDWIYTVDVEDFSIETVEPFEKPGKEILDVEPLNWTYDGEVAYLVSTRDGFEAYLGTEKLPIDGGTVTSLEKVGGEIFLTYSSFTTPSGIYRLVDGRLERIHGSDPDQEIIGKVKKVSYVWIKSKDGLEIPTYILESDAPKPGPTVIYVHGGPWSHVMDAWSILILGLVAAGFHVVAPNFRGSTGYGTKFMKMDIGDPGGMDMEDIEAATNYAVETGLASKKAIMGYSYGGFMTFLSTVKKPDTWDVGVAGAGIVDWEEMFELGDAFFKQFALTLFDNRRDLWKDRSAINFVDNLKAPLCIIHPQNDTRTPLKPVLRYMEKLLEKGKSFEAHIIPDMGHTITTVDDIFKLLLPAVIFLRKKLYEE